MNEPTWKRVSTQSGSYIEEFYFDFITVQTVHQLISNIFYFHLSSSIQYIGGLLMVNHHKFCLKWGYDPKQATQTLEWQFTIQPLSDQPKTY